MDRLYKHADTVNVYNKDRLEGEPVSTFKQQPYTVHGTDCYMFRGRLHVGYVNIDSGEVFILLSKPLARN